MPRFRPVDPPEAQARAVVGRLVNLGALRRRADRPASRGTVRAYRDCLTQVTRYLAPARIALRDLTPAIATEYLHERAGELGQKALDQHRQALQATLVHVCRRPPEGGRLPVVKTHRRERLTGRAYTRQQVRLVAAAQRGRNALATLVAHAAGLRAHELLTLARPQEQPADIRRAARGDKFTGRPGVDYTVVGKGGLVRLVRLPHDFADRLEAVRREAPVRVTDREIHYTSRYDVGGGNAWSTSFSAASKRVLGWSEGAHGVRHSYAQERMAELQLHFLRDDALEIVSQELGHFRPEVTLDYMR